MPPCLQKCLQEFRIFPLNHPSISSYHLLRDSGRRRGYSKYFGLLSKAHLHHVSFLLDIRLSVWQPRTIDVQGKYGLIETDK